MNLKKKQKAALHNLGCKVNAYETEAMRQLLEEAGYEIVDFSQKADVYVINTCSVTNIADRKSRQMLRRAKRQNPESIVIAAGCYAQTKADEARKEPAIDIILGNNKKKDLIAALNAYREDRRLSEAVLQINHRQPYEELGLRRTAEHTRAFVKVQDGCDQFCSYCIIPYARGRARSRSMEDALAEARALAGNGFREIVLTGIHLSSYGTDTGVSLLRLISETAGIRGIDRIRLGSLEPGIVTEEFARKISKIPKICPHFHLSLQSGCDATLFRMNRKYTAAEYEKSCAILRNYFEHPAITTDVIVGFPGETEEEFEETRAFLQKIHFYEMHIFKYSRREGTKAASMPGQVPEREKKRRSDILLALADRMSEEFRGHYLGKDVEVLMEEETAQGGRPYFTGYTKEYVKIALETDGDLQGRLVTGTVIGKVKPGLYLMA